MANRGLTARASGMISASTVTLVAGVVDVLAGSKLDIAIIYPIAIVIAATARDRRYLWGLTTAAIGLGYLGGLVGQEAGSLAALADRTLLACTIVSIAYFVDSWIVAEQRIEAQRSELVAQNATLEAGNQELSAREEEIARQNEELQSQSEELERQSEELRVANDELAFRERTLAQLLALSRSLTGELTRDEVMNTVCEWIADLLGDSADASALLVRQGDTLHSRCQFGFGENGPVTRDLRYEASFGYLLISRGQAGFLQDVALRPELAILEPAGGPPFRAVLGAPLVIRGRAIGTIEAYSHQPISWTEEQMNLVASIAAQASLSLETAELFEEVSLQKTRFETVLRTLPLAVFSCDDPECKVVSGNPAAAAFFSAPLNANFSPFTPLGKRLNSAFHRQGEPIEAMELPIVKAVLHGEEILREELDLVFPSGRRANLLVSAAPYYDAEGKISGGACAIVDITEQKALQRELDARRRESEEVSVRKTRFLAAMSHDIRTPTNAIRLQAELIKRYASDATLADRVPELAHRIDRNATALVDLIGDVLDLTRFDSGKIELSETDFSLGDAIAEECQHLAPLAEDKGLALICEQVEPTIWLHADRVKVARILGNLIENAIKFTVAGTVRVAAEFRRGELELSVADTGPGIPPAEQARVFDEFYQLGNPERASGRGRGLGLAICQRLVNVLGGRIELESEVGKGTRFVVTIPADRVAGQVSGIPRDELGDLSAGAARERGAQLKVLVAEDHEDSRRATADLLTANGYEVIEAGDGQTTLALLRERSPAVLLLDLMLPDLDGVQVLERVRSLRPPSLAALIVLSGDLATRSREDLERLGANDVLNKPVNSDQLLAAIRRCTKST